MSSGVGLSLVGETVPFNGSLLRDCIFSFFDQGT